MKQPYNTALYMRLSRDDENYGDSVSIETQRTILQQFAKEQELHVVGEYIDDGWSGTTFERPNFKRMMADVDAGRVNCIVTKDLSRFGRDHIMVCLLYTSWLDVCSSPIIIAIHSAMMRCCLICSTAPLVRLWSLCAVIFIRCTQTKCSFSIRAFCSVTVNWAELQLRWFPCVWTPCRST